MFWQKFTCVTKEVPNLRHMAMYIYQGSPLAVFAGGSARTKSEKSISRPDKIPPPGQNLYAPGHWNWYIFTHRNLDSISAARQWRNAIKHRLKILVKTSLTSCRKLARTLALERRDHFASLCTNHIEFSMLSRPPSLRAITNTAFSQTFSRLRSWKQP